MGRLPALLRLRRPLPWPGQRQARAAGAAGGRDAVRVVVQVEALVVVVKAEGRRVPREVEIHRDQVSRTRKSLPLRMGRTRWRLPQRLDPPLWARAMKRRIRPSS